MRQLPTCVREDNKYRYGLAALLALLALYATTNTLQWRAPYQLPPTWLDMAIPLVPATVWLYASYALIVITAFVVEKDTLQLNRFLYAQVAANVISAVAYVVWPTTFARPSLQGQDGMSVAALQFVWLMDAPVNCFPSLHVCSSLLPALMLWRHHPRARIVYLVWALVIAASTMTTKQHHVADVVAGAVLAALVFWLFFVRARYAPVPSKLSV